MNSAPSPPRAAAELTKSAVAGWFIALAVLNFVAAVLGVFLLFSSNSTDNAQGAIFLPVGMTWR